MFGYLHTRAYPSISLILFSKILAPFRWLHCVPFTRISKHFYACMHSLCTLLSSSTIDLMPHIPPLHCHEGWRDWPLTLMLLTLFLIVFSRWKWLCCWGPLLKKTTLSDSLSQQYHNQQDHNIMVSTVPQITVSTVPQCHGHNSTTNLVLQISLLVQKISTELLLNLFPKNYLFLKLRSILANMHLL